MSMSFPLIRRLGSIFKNTKKDHHIWCTDTSLQAEIGELLHQNMASSGTQLTKPTSPTSLSSQAQSQISESILAKVLNEQAYVARMLNNTHHHLVHADGLWSEAMFCCLFNHDTQSVESVDTLTGVQTIPELYRIERKDRTKAYIFYHVLNDTVPRWAYFKDNRSSWVELPEDNVPAEVRLAKELV